MSFPVGAALLDALVLAVVSEGDTYGYKITQQLKEAVDLSESTLCPVLRRLQKDECLTAYDMEYLGRNRRYYKITPKGLSLLSTYRNEWGVFKESVSKVMNGEGNR
jgi:PadR family transcriptional regulator PadR